MSYQRTLRIFRRAVLCLLANIWRRFLFRTTFIALTGSVGKTTTKECIAAILSSRFPTAKTLNNHNDLIGVARTILKVRPWHRFAVIEIGTERAGMIRRSARMVRPDIAIVLSVAKTHVKNFPTLDDTAKEKSQILQSVSKRGLAILNAEDPRVRRMASGCPCEVKMFGLTRDLDLWAEEVSSKWPARLNLRVHSGSESEWMRTKLVGDHWVNAVLASVLVTHICGISLKDIASEFGHIQPFMGRMQPLITPGGATILRDEENGALDTMHAAIKVLQDSTSQRKVLVMTDVSDCGLKTRVRMKQFGVLASHVAGMAVFVGESGYHAVKAAVSAGMNPDSVRDFKELSRAAEYLRSELRSGDLVLIKGRTTHHLSRLVFAQWGKIGCWKKNCRKRILCDICESLKPDYDLHSIYDHTREIEMN